MRTLRIVLFSALMAAAPATVLAQNSGNLDLLSFAMSDAQLIAGAHLDAVENAPFGQFVLSHLPSGDAFFQSIISETGVDPRSDLNEILVATNGAPNTGVRWLAGAHGSFGQAIATIEDAAQKHGANITHLPGIDLIAVPVPAGTNAPESSVCLALYIDGMTAAIGDCASVQSAIQLAGAQATLTTQVGLKAQQLRAQQDLWFTSVIPLGQFAGLLPAGGPGNLLQNNLFQGIQQTSGGVKFDMTAQGPAAQISGEVVMDTSQNATALLNVLNFIVQMIQMNAASNPAVGNFAALLQSLQASTNNNTLNVSLNIPESALEHLVDMGSAQTANPAGRAFRLAR